MTEFAITDAMLTYHGPRGPRRWEGWQRNFLEGLFVLYDDRAAMAVLRRAAGLTLAQALTLRGFPALFYGVLTVRPSEDIRPLWEKEKAMKAEQAAFITAVLFATYRRPGELHPPIAEEGDMGTHLAESVAGKDSEDAAYKRMARRMSILLATHFDQLADYLRQALGLLRASQDRGTIPIQWSQLFYDIQMWDEEDHPVQRRWAVHFWKERS